MAKDFYDKLKISSEVLKNNWPLVLMFITAVSSGMGNIGQYFTMQEAEEENVNQIAAIVEHLTATPKIVQSPCGDCINRIKQLERWHQ